MLSRLKKPIRDRPSRARSARSTHGSKGIRSGGVQLQDLDNVPAPSPSTWNGDVVLSASWRSADLRGARADVTHLGGSRGRI